jgi:hypothetical protein
VVRGLLGQERDSDFLTTASCGVAVLRGDACGAARWGAVRMFEGSRGIFDIPIALILLAVRN